MAYKTLISTKELRDNLNDPNWAILDCRFVLTDTDRGRRDYQQGHIPGALYAHLDDDLSGPIVPGKTSRHPLPEVEIFAKTLSDWGVDRTVQVVAYDAAGGAIAARLWWMVRWLGHEAVAVLDGGWPRWLAEEQPVSREPVSRPARVFRPRPAGELLVDADEVQSICANDNYRLFDARSADRYRGENETLDPVAGHIPGAISLPFAGNLGADGRFLPAETLQARYQDQVGQVPPERTVFYCGSGVTAAHNILAMAHAGLGDARLYAGSWSEWITDPGRPVS
jgi:thiosulfate/3-mercaptopyruvate sulfurtransferase